MLGDGFLDPFGFYGRVKEPFAEHFNLEVQSWEDMTAVVIDHNNHWTNADRKSKKMFKMHRLKSFRQADINKLHDFTKMNVG